MTRCASGSSRASRPATTELEVLRDVSFRVGRGEFLGIAGRNGSGKSTLLKLVAGIYRPDAGEIRAAGRLAPIIELGVGFNNELEAYDNVVMNAVMMGLEPSEARARYPEIIDFAELRDFEHLKLKNYSSGMRARLGFATMVHVDADLLLFDEVLAVGDAGLSGEVRRDLLAAPGVRPDRGPGDALDGSPAAHCDEALLLEGGRVLAAGSPEEVAQEYESLRGAAAGRSPRQRERGAGMSEVSTRPLRVERAEGSPRERMAPAAPQPLRPIEGPSAFGGGRRRFLNLLWLTSAQQYRLQYRTSVLGHVWAILRPLTLFGVLYFVFTQVLGFGGGIEEYALMVLLGIMLFMFFAGRDRHRPRRPRSERAGGAQDALPEDRDPALRGALDRDDRRDQPARHARLRARLRAGCAVDLAPGPRRLPGPGDPHDRGGAPALDAVRPDQRRRPDLGGDRPGPVLCEPDPLPVGARARASSRRSSR